MDSRKLSGLPIIGREEISELIFSKLAPAEIAKISTHPSVFKDKYYKIKEEGDLSFFRMCESAIISKSNSKSTQFPAYVFGILRHHDINIQDRLVLALEGAVEDDNHNLNFNDIYTVEFGAVGDYEIVEKLMSQQ